MPQGLKNKAKNNVEGRDYMSGSASEMKIPLNATALKHLDGNRKSPEEKGRFSEVVGNKRNATTNFLEFIPDEFTVPRVSKEIG